MKKALVRLPAPRTAPLPCPEPGTARPPFALRTRLVSATVLLAGMGLLASRPARTAGGPIPVTVANTPLATTATDNPAKQPVELQGNLSRPGTFSTFYTVPAGKRLVIEYVNVVSNVPNDPNGYSFILDHDTVFTNFSVVPDGSPYVAASQKVLLYANAGTNVAGFFQYSGGNSSPNIYFTISGYLVDVP